VESGGKLWGSKSEKRPLDGVDKRQKKKTVYGEFLRGVRWGSIQENLKKLEYDSTQEELKGRGPKMQKS